MKKILTLSVITIAVLGLCGVAVVNAQAESGSGPFSIIIQKFVERFGLNPEEVQEVFDEVREERMQEMQARFEEKWSGEMPEFGLPKCTQLTDEQKEALKVLREEYGDLKDFSLEERQAKMQEMREKIEAWAEEQGIDLKCVRGGMLGHGFRGFGRGFGW